jgi:hypothetical protein
VTDTLQKHIVRLASGLTADISTTDSVGVVSAMLESNSQPTWNLIPPVLQSMPADFVLEPGFRRKTMELLGIHFRQKSWISSMGERLAEWGIPVLLMKGHNLWGRIYSENYPRLSADVDMLVNPDHYGRMRDMLFPEADFYRESAKHTVFVIKKPYSIQVEIHKSFSEAGVFDVDYPAVWNDSVAHELFQNKMIRCMSLEDSVIHGVIHSYSHLKLRPYMTVDLIRLLSHPELNTGSLHEKLLRCGCNRLLSGLVELIGKTYGCEGQLEHHRTVRRACLLNKTVSFVFNDKPSRYSTDIKPLLRWILLDKRDKRKAAFRKSIRMLLRHIRTQMNR